jgi:hypothetical protein
MTQKDIDEGWREQRGIVRQLEVIERHTNGDITATVDSTGYCSGGTVQLNTEQQQRAKHLLKR